jgi:glycerol-3-phosphate O-acyltransferase / dihydroxyacetone phosphate acyltransferase
MIIPTLSSCFSHTLRRFEDAVSSLRAFTSLLRLLRAHPNQLAALRQTRTSLHARVLSLATGTLGLPEDPEDFYIRIGGRQKGRAVGKWESRAKYFSLRRRRKRDWNETLRLYDKVDYPQVE